MKFTTTQCDLQMIAIMSLCTIRKRTKEIGVQDYLRLLRKIRKKRLLIGIQLKIVKALKNRMKKVDKINEDTDEQFMSSQSLEINPNNNKESLNHDISDEVSEYIKRDDTLKGILINQNHKRYATQGKIDEMDSKDKIKTSKMTMSFDINSRKDVEGHPILPGGHYKIMFADEVEDDRKHSLATTHVVESYKKYNAPS